MSAEAQPSGGVQPQIPPMPSSVSLIATLGLIAMVAGLLVVLVYQYTLPIIVEKERKALEAAVVQVIPAANPDTAVRVSYSLTGDGLIELDDQTADQANLYAVYDQSGKLAGLAMQAAAQGYQDVVRTLYGYDPGCECIVGLTVLKSTDTPGMGDKGTVEGNEKFMANFEKLDVSLTADKSALAHPIETVKHGNKTEPWQVDAMSGATITSRAIANGLLASAGEMLPLLAQHLDDLKVKN